MGGLRWVASGAGLSNIGFFASHGWLGRAAEFLFVEKQKGASRMKVVLLDFGFSYILSGEPRMNDLTAVGRLAYLLLTGHPAPEDNARIQWQSAFAGLSTTSLSLCRSLVLDGDMDHDAALEHSWFQNTDESTFTPLPDTAVVNLIELHVKGKLYSSCLNVLRGNVNLDFLSAKEIFQRKDPYGSGEISETALPRILGRELSLNAALAAKVTLACVKNFPGNSPNSVRYAHLAEDLDYLGREEAKQALWMAFVDATANGEVDALVIHHFLKTSEHPLLRGTQLLGKFEAFLEGRDLSTAASIRFEDLYMALFIR